MSTSLTKESYKVIQGTRVYKDFPLRNVEGSWWSRSLVPHETRRGVDQSTVNLSSGDGHPTPDHDYVSEILVVHWQLNGPGPDHRRRDHRRRVGGDPGRRLDTEDRSRGSLSSDVHVWGPVQKGCGPSSFSTIPRTHVPEDGEMSESVYDQIDIHFEE